MKPDKKSADRGESLALMEPLLVSQDSRFRGPLTDLAFALVQKATAFRHSMPASLVISLAGLVRSMNCYYSNFIEGHETHPVDIEKALRKDYSRDPVTRNLQLEAKAHIAVQEWIDSGALPGTKAVTSAAILELHRRFCGHLPGDLSWVEVPDTRERIRIIPGQLRTRDVRVGQHLPISPGALPRFLERFEEIYSSTGKTEFILSCAAAHHRLLWMHPFLDGNGRVARLMSHAMLLSSLDTGGVWSVARGLARSVGTYKRLLAECDQTRRNDLDGRGNLSEEALNEFTKFFLSTCLDQVTFMDALVQPDRLRARILLWAEEEVRLGSLPAKAGAILEAILFRGELPRQEVQIVCNTGERNARRISSALLSRGVISAESHISPLRLVFSAELAPRWLPGLFPEY
jgi:Fic family protein